MTALLAITRAQAVFSVALGFVTLGITLFALYVLSTAAWSDRWYRGRRRGRR